MSNVSPSPVSSSLPSPVHTPEHLKNNHLPLDSNPHSLLSPTSPALSNTSVEDYLLPKALTTASVKISTALVDVLMTPQDWLAEILYILRPLVYGKLFSFVISQHSNMFGSFSSDCRSPFKSPTGDGSHDGNLVKESTSQEFGLSKPGTLGVRSKRPRLALVPPPRLNLAELHKASSPNVPLTRSI